MQILNSVAFILYISVITSYVYRYLIQQNIALSLNESVNLLFNNIYDRRIAETVDKYFII